ncbi:hypothetical protein J2S49_000241 [Arcanobacterium wilhelmae]|uniref:DUF7455 domain-containing protein n=1 Tax=Arcanobacterium wilhelmae TaxID=1803177 RepID=A0ABT9N8Z4_9ACTO|nr:hypothetical protein [Arcanobacterium wilhelmae]MDP9800165.1 hypothetical protein [Arcanobacterium wilhelmae]WFN89605.1 hypothetical protein P8A24_05195 [Arcanobacterium wilhelmae]
MKSVSPGLSFSASGERNEVVWNFLHGPCFDVGVNTMEETLKPTLTTADRCDACGAQAYVRVTMPFGELLFCAHHAAEHKSKIDELAISIVDERERIAR